MKYLFIFPKTMRRNAFYSQLEPIIEFLYNKGHTSYVYFGLNPEMQISLNSSVLVSNKNDFKRLLKEVDYIYIRNVYNFLPIFAKKMINWKVRGKIIYNFRGFASYESYYGQKNPLKFVFFLVIEFLAYRYSFHASVVSSVFKKELDKHFGCKSNVSIIPCCIKDVHKKENRHGAEIKFVYVGSTLKWQKFEETIEIFNQISKHYINARLTLFTNDEKKANDYLKTNHIENVKVGFLNHNDLLIELRNHDFGFLIRDDVMLNNVASPIKFAEYLSCGIIPIISKGVGDYYKLVMEEKIGIVVNENGLFDIDDINKYLADENVYTRIYDNAMKLTWNVNLNNFPQ